MIECIPYVKFLQQMGVSVTTGWQWEHSGLLKTFLRYGRKYILQSEIERFQKEGGLELPRMPESIPFSKFLRQMGVSSTTGWRWECLGRVKTFRCHKRKYIPLSEIERFHREGEAYERPPIMPPAAKARSKPAPVPEPVAG